MVRMFGERRSLGPCLDVAFGGEVVRCGVLEDSLIPSWKLRQVAVALGPRVEGASVHARVIHVVFDRYISATATLCTPRRNSAHPPMTPNVNAHAHPTRAVTPTAPPLLSHGRDAQTPTTVTNAWTQHPNADGDNEDKKRPRRDLDIPF